MTDTVLSEDLKPTNAVIAPATVSALQRLPGVDGAAAAALPQTLWPPRPRRSRRRRR